MSKKRGEEVELKNRESKIKVQSDDLFAP